MSRAEVEVAFGTPPRHTAPNGRVWSYLLLT